jgi:hypothetical protein
MPKKFVPSDLLAQAASVQDAWARIDSKLSFGSLSLTALMADIEGLRGLEGDMVSLENQLTALRNQRDALQEATWEKVKRVRSAFKGIYGDDSSQYELVGGTRMSDRKTPRRSPAPVE